MNIVVHNYYQEHNTNNFMFNSLNCSIGDNLMRPFHVLKEIASQQDITVGTWDFFSSEKISAYIFVDLPRKSDPIFIRAQREKVPLFLILLENPMIRPDNWNRRNHGPFQKVFLWKDDEVDNVKYFKINYAQSLPTNLNFEETKRSKFCTLIAGHKIEHTSGELYTKRIEAIRWFEKNHLEQFDLYGVGWDKMRFSGILKPLNLIHRCPWTSLSAHYPSYRGRIERKSEVLKNYKFTICFENFTGVNGYITEKIFDAFFAGTIPIYWGADNILDFIPADTFIDFRKFESYEELYQYLNTLSEIELKSYRNRIHQFLTSNKFFPFSSESFARILLTHIV